MPAEIVLHAKRTTATMLCVVPLVVLIAGIHRAHAQETAAPPPQAPGLFQEPAIFGKAAELIGEKLEPSPGVPKNGFFPEFGYMINGSGWISVGPGYRHTFLGGRGLFDTSAAISWRAYKIVQTHVEVRPNGGSSDTGLVLGAQGFWQDLTQIRYFGLGPGSTKSARSAYRLQDFNTIGWARVGVKGVAITGTVGWLRRPKIIGPAGPFKGHYPDTRERFGNEGAPGIEDPASFFHGDVSAVVDTRDVPHHPTRGGLYRVGWTGYRDLDSGQFSFQRVEGEATQFVPLASRNWVLALHGWIVGSNTADGKTVPVYMMPTLGGGNTLRGYLDYRFHDRHLLLASVESRWAVLEHLDAALFFDAGNVAPRLGDLNLRKTSVGAGLRVHSHAATIGRLDVAYSGEGWSLWFKLNDPYALSRLGRRTAAVPFVP